MDGEIKIPHTERPFLATVTCDIMCRPVVESKRKKTGDSRISVMTTYDPQARGLKPGNGGNLLGSLSADLQLFSDQTCMAKATSECGAANQIAKLQTLSIASGDWGTNLPLPCTTEKRKRILSPFAPISQVEVSESPVTPVSRLFGDYSSAKNLKQCTAMIEAKLCYGDCVEKAGKDWQHYLATEVPSETMKMALCGDQLVKFFATHRILSPEVREVYCRTFFWEERFAHADSKDFKAISRCAAWRAELNCSALMRK